MLDFIQMVVSGIAVGSSYALMGMAMVIIYKTSEVPNFAQGEMALISAFFAYMLLDTYGWPYFAAFPAALIFSLILGAFLEFAVLRSGQGTQYPRTDRHHHRSGNGFVGFGFLEIRR